MTISIDHISFSLSDLDHFGIASQDRNPLHLSEHYARKTPFGERVTFGIFSALTSLARLQSRPQSQLANITLEFHSPIFTGVDYQVEVNELSTDQAGIKLYDGKRLMMRVEVNFCAKELPIADSYQPPNIPLRAQARELDPTEIKPGFTISGDYAPARSEFNDLIKQLDLQPRGISDRQVAALMWTSYLIGMELPGQQALYSKLTLKFEHSNQNNDQPLHYQAKVIAFDRRFDLLRLEAQLFCAERLIANAELRAFIRPAPVTLVDDPELQLPSSTVLNNKVALVIGASRGLGAWLTTLLARQGCTVYANFYKSATEAEKLQASLASATGKVILAPGNGSDSAWCEDIKTGILRDYGRLDLLICNACPAMLPLWLEPHSLQRINDYVARSLSLVTAPMAALLETVANNAGCNIVISSAFVTTTPPADLPHYVSAKYAIEGITKAIAPQYPAARFLIVRPPVLLTDLTNTLLLRQEAIHPAKVAAAIIARAQTTDQADNLAIMQDF